jgi:hypothetical protein
MTDLQALLIVLPSMGVIAILVWAWVSYFPVVLDSKFRIKEKSVGIFHYYKAQVKRPIFGWSTFHASTNYGTINSFGDWDRDKSYAENNISKYQSLRPYVLYKA